MAKNNDSKSVAATTGIQYYGKDSQEQKALSVRFYGTSCVIGLHRPLPADKQTINSKYDYKSGTEIYLKPKAAKALARLLKRAIDSKANGEKIVANSLPSGTNLIEVGSGDKYNCDKNSICLALYKNIDGDTKKPESVDVFEFKDDMIISNYDPEAGSYDSDTMDIDIDYLIDQLKDFSKSASNGSVHNMKAGLKYDMDKVINRQIKMAQALGVDVEAVLNRPNWSNSSNNSGGGGSVSYSETTSDLLDEIAKLS